MESSSAMYMLYALEMDAAVDVSFFNGQLFNGQSYVRNPSESTYCGVKVSWLNSQQPEGVGAPYPDQGQFIFCCETTAHE